MYNCLRRRFIEPFPLVSIADRISTKCNLFRYDNATDSFEYVNVTVVSVMPSKMRMNMEYNFWYNNLAKLLITGLVPFVSLCVFNFKASVIRRVRTYLKLYLNA